MIYDIAVCAIVKDEAPYLKEWVDYHLNIGVQYFIIYDNNSAVPVREVLREYVKDKVVEVVECPIIHSPQLKAYMHGLYTMHDRASWLAFIDIDEFIVLKRHDNIVDFLQDYEEYAGVCINWLIYTANGHISKPGGKVFDTYTAHLPYSEPVNSHVKTILQPRYALIFSTPHSAFYDGGYYSVNEKREACLGPLSPFSNDIIQINHYHTKSYEEWLEKINKGMVNSASIMRKAEEFWAYNKDMLHLQAEVEKKNTVRRYPIITNRVKYPNTIIHWNKVINNELRYRYLCNSKG